PSGVGPIEACVGHLRGAMHTLRLKLGGGVGAPAAFIEAIKISRGGGDVFEDGGKIAPCKRPHRHGTLRGMHDVKLNGLRARRPDQETAAAAGRPMSAEAARGGLGDAGFELLRGLRHVPTTFLPIGANERPFNCSGSEVFRPEKNARVRRRRGDERVLTRLQEIMNAGERNLDPIGAVVQLVSEFVDGLLKKIKVEERGEFAATGGKERRAGGRLEILREKLRAGPAAPGRGPGQQALAVRGSVPAARIEERRNRRVVKRAQHSGYVLQRGALGATFGQGARRLTFKINDDEIGAGPKNLAEMVIAMNAGTRGANGARERGMKAIEDFRLAVEERGGRGAHRRRKAFALQAKQAEDLLGEFAEALFEFALKGRRERLRRE